jgi:ABC-type Fe3+ transport system substrate-binding protein
MKKIFVLPLVVAAAIGCGAVAAFSQTGIGKTFEQIESLAVKEGKVRVASALQPDEEPLVLKGFYQKYPKIKVEHTRVSGAARTERFFTEALAGLVEFDLYDISDELKAKFVKAGLLAGPLEWRKLFPAVPEIHFSPDGYFVGVGFSTQGISYNTSLVPKERTPKKWEDCLDPYWKGKFVVDTRPRTFATLSVAWGEAKTLDYVNRLKNNQPIWKRGQSEALTQLAAGEHLMLCGAYYQSTHRILMKDPKARLAMSLPTELPVGMGEAPAVMKAAQNPNAAVLLLGWLASSEGQKGYDQIGRGSPFVEGTEKWRRMQEAGAKPIFGGWGAEYETAMLQKITSVWGFRGEKR